MNVLITGASRGIGLEFCRQALSQDHQVLAVTRQGEPASLLELQKQNSGLKIAKIDIADASDIERLAENVRAWGKLDLLINNAGVFRKGEALADFTASFHINAVAPFQVTRALLPSLRKGTAPRAVQISSLMGSIADNGSGGSYAYRSSKAALNMLNKCLAIENSWLISTVLHPGWVRTEMGGAGASLVPADSVGGMWRVIQGLKAKDSGGFFDYRGKPLPW